jgi:hypothetical protein
LLPYLNDDAPDHAELAVRISEDSIEAMLEVVPA